LEGGKYPANQADLLHLTDLLIEFCRSGEDERQAALKILDIFAGYTRAQRRMSAGGPWR
jgi:hypothetical protein